MPLGGCPSKGVERGAAEAGTWRWERQGPVRVCGSEEGQGDYKQGWRLARRRAEERGEGDSSPSRRAVSSLELPGATFQPLANVLLSPFVEV